MQDNLRLTIYCDEADITHGKASFEMVVQRAQEIQCKHVVVTSSILGARQGNNASYLAETLPVVIEVIAPEERMNMLLPFVKEIIKEGTVTLEKVHVR